MRADCRAKAVRGSAMEALRSANWLRGRAENARGADGLLDLFLPGRELRLLGWFHQVLRHASQEELKLVGGDGAGKRVAQVVLVGVILAGVLVAPLALGDDVVLEGDRSPRGSA